MQSPHLKIVFVNSVSADTLGGGELWFARMAKALQERGHKIILLARKDARIIPLFEAFPCTIRAFYFGCDFNPIAIRQLRRYFRIQQPDAVVANFNKDVSTAGIAAKWSGVPRVIFRNGFPLLQKKIKHRFMLPYFDLIVTNSRRLVSQYKSYNLGLENRMTVIYNGLDTSAMQPRNLPAKRWKPLQLIGAGRLTATKNFTDFIRVAAAINDISPVKATILGEGDERGRLQDLAQKLGVNLSLPGHVEDIHSYFRKTDFFLHTSRNEGMPNVVMEAMAAGIPSIATDAGATHELISHGVDGLVFPVGATQEMVAGINMLVKDMNRYNLMAHAAQKTIRERFDFQRSVEQFEHVLLP